jgi:uncharacterized protein YkwD
MTPKFPRASNNIFDIVNKTRSKRHISKLHFDPILAKAALTHSRDMAKNHYCSHINKKGKDQTDRVVKLGFDINKGHYSGVGENCGQISTGRVVGLGYISNTERGIALGFIKLWKNSEPHWRNIINPDYNLTGIGVATDGKIYYATQVFYG